MLEVRPQRIDILPGTDPLRPFPFLWIHGHYIELFTDIQVEQTGTVSREQKQC